MIRRFFHSTIKDKNAFIFEINTVNTSTNSSSDTQFKLPLISVGTYNFIINWGDATSNRITAWNQAETTHTYASSGTYTITISGTCIGWRFGQLNNGNDHLKILNILQWGSLQFLNNSGVTQGVFRDCQNLEVTAADMPDFSNVTTLWAFFRGCTTLNNNLSHWDVSTLTNLREWFYLCSNFNNGNNSEINNWDTSNMTDIQSVFSDSPFNQPIGSWDVSNVTNFQTVFRNNSHFNQDISTWDTSSATNLREIFLNCTVFNQSIGNWDVSNVTDFTRVFQGCTDFDQNVGSWDVSKSTSFTGFLFGKNPSTFSASNLDAIYNGWSNRTFVNTGLVFTASTAKYTSAGQVGRDILTGAPNNWTITDGGQV